MAKDPLAQKCLTVKQDNIFEFIKSSILESGYPPTVREVADSFGITVKGAYDHIKAIEKKGHIKTEQNKSRAIVVVDLNHEPQADSINIPFLGRIAAGTPILAEENIEDYLAFPKGAFGSGVYFALEVRGDSMIEAGINSGDIAVIKQTESAENGEIVAVLNEEGATLKRYKIVEGTPVLMPENSAYKPIQVTEESRVIGRLAGLFRTYH
jgi:repressor LexA